MAVRIRLKRLGAKKRPFYRVVVADQRSPRDGRFIENIGKYHPLEDPSIIEIDEERALYWLGVGAQPSEPVQRLLEKTGDWQKFKGLPAPEPLKVAAERVDRQARYEAEAQAAAGLAESAAAAAAPAKSTRKKAAKAAAPEAEKTEERTGADNAEQQG